jgi:hypothetical protein
MKHNIEKEIYNLRLVLNRMVSQEVSLTDDKIVELSVKLDKLLNIYHDINGNN